MREDPSTIAGGITKGEGGRTNISPLNKKKKKTSQGLGQKGEGGCANVGKSVGAILSRSPSLRKERKKGAGPFATPAGNGLNRKGRFHQLAGRWGADSPPHCRRLEKKRSARAVLQLLEDAEEGEVFLAFIHKTIGKSGEGSDTPSISKLQRAALPLYFWFGRGRERRGGEPLLSPVLHKGGKVYPQRGKIFKRGKKADGGNRPAFSRCD